MPPVIVLLVLLTVFASTACAGGDTPPAKAPSLAQLERDLICAPKAHELRAFARETAEALCTDEPCRVVAAIVYGLGESRAIAVCPIEQPVAPACDGGC